VPVGGVTGGAGVTFRVVSLGSCASAVRPATRSAIVANTSVT